MQNLSLRLLLPAAVLSSALFGSALIAATPFSYSNDFSNITDGTKLTDVAESNVDYFYRSEFGPGFTYTDDADKGLLFQSGRLRANWSHASPGGSAFAFRNLTDGGLLGSGQYLVNPSVTTAVTWQFGGSDAKLWNYVGLLDADGSGYVAGIARNGEVAIYQVDNGLGNNFSAWGTPLATKTFAATATAATGGVWTILNFSIVDDTLTFSTSRTGGTSDSLSVVLDSLVYTEFTTVALGARMVERERSDFDYLNVGGAVVPEPATTALLIGGFVLCVSLFLRRRGKRLEQ